MPQSWSPTCAVCETLNQWKTVAPATTSLHGVPLCRDHVREVHASESSGAAKAVRKLAR